MEMVKHHRDRTRARSKPAGEFLDVPRPTGPLMRPTELLEAIGNVLRLKVYALSEDNWMFEAEDATLAL